MRTTRTGPAGPDPAGPDPAEAVAALYQLHYPSLVRLAALLVPDPAMAEDIVQEAFAALHGEWPTLPGTEAGVDLVSGEPGELLAALSAPMVTCRRYGRQQGIPATSGAGNQAAGVRLAATRRWPSRCLNTSPARL